MNDLLSPQAILGIGGALVVVHAWILFYGGGNGSLAGGWPVSGATPHQTTAAPNMAKQSGDRGCRAPIGRPRADLHAPDHGVRRWIDPRHAAGRVIRDPDIRFIAKDVGRSNPTGHPQPLGRRQFTNCFARFASVTWLLAKRKASSLV